MKCTSIDKLVYEYMFPKARPNDPDDFNAFLSRWLIAEVRSETQAFYGHLDTQEAKYPGLDYTNRTHRIRLSRYPWHRRLFRAFDGLGLTAGEIANLTRWEGTKWAKEKYEAEHGVEIRDSTADGMATWDDDLGYAVGGIKIKDEDDEIMNQDEDEEEEEEEVTATTEGPAITQPAEEEASEPEFESVGVALNARLRAGAARREAGETDAVLDEDWEQWLKHIVDSGLLRENMSDESFRQFFETTVVPAGLVPSSVMAAARGGRWSEVPEYLHSLLRRSIETEQTAQGPWRTGAFRRTIHAGTRRRTLSGLRPPVEDANAWRRAAEYPGA